MSPLSLCRAGTLVCAPRCLSAQAPLRELAAPLCIALSVARLLPLPSVLGPAHTWRSVVGCRFLFKVARAVAPQAGSSRSMLDSAASTLPICLWFRHRWSSHLWGSVRCFLRFLSDVFCQMFFVRRSRCFIRLVLCQK